MQVIMAAKMQTKVNSGAESVPSLTTSDGASKTPHHVSMNSLADDDNGTTTTNCKPTTNGTSAHLQQQHSPPPPLKFINIDPNERLPRLELIPQLSFLSEEYDEEVFQRSKDMVHLAISSKHEYSPSSTLASIN